MQSLGQPARRPGRGEARSGKGWEEEGGMERGGGRERNKDKEEAGEGGGGAEEEEKRGRDASSRCLVVNLITKADLTASTVVCVCALNEEEIFFHLDRDVEFEQANIVEAAPLQRFRRQ